MMNVGGEDLYIDSVDSLSAMDSASVIEESVGCKWDYAIWMNEPRSIQSRREDFLRRMELGDLGIADKDMTFERVTECSGAISLSGSGSVDESLIYVGREMEGKALSHVDDLDSQDSTACCTEKEVATVEGLCYEASSVKMSEKTRITLKPLSRWWSHLYKKPARKGGAEPASLTPKMNEMKVRCNKKKCPEFSSLYVGQEIKAHKGFILTMKFSPDGQYLASGGQDGVVRVWRVLSEDTSTNYSIPDCVDLPKTKFSTAVVPDKVFQIDELPYLELHGHSGDILDLAWSKANYLLSSSKDKTVRLWEVGSDDCLNVYYHNDYVTSIQFNPVDDKYFISGSIDGKVRIWGVSNGRVVDWVYAKDVVTALCYKPDGHGFVVGSISGICRFYGVDASKEHIQLEAQIDVKGRKNSSHNKITGIEFSHKEDQRMMITSKDSKVIIFDGIHMTHKFKGLRNSGSQMSASFTSTEKHIISVGEDSRVYVWNYDCHPTTSNSKQTKSIHSCKHFFFSEGVSVALPWLGRASNEHRNELPPSKRQQQRAEIKGTDGFSLGSWFSMDNQCCSSGAATWPEEQLLPYATGNNENLCFQNEKSAHCSEAWDVVIATGSLDGRIRIFHNFGLLSSQ